MVAHVNLFGPFLAVRCSKTEMTYTVNKWSNLERDKYDEEQFIDSVIVNESSSWSAHEKS